MLHIQKVRGIGGSERHLLSLLPALAEAGIGVHMCVLTAGESESFTRQMRRLDVPTTTFLAGPHVNPLAAGAIRSLIGRLRPDMVHTHLVHGDLHGQIASRWAGVPAVSSVHGTPRFYRRPPVLLVGRAAGRLAAARIAVSEHVRSYLLELGMARPDRIRVIHYGIDPRPWREAVRGRADARRMLGLEPGDLAVGIAARVIEGKGHRALIEAARAASRQVPNLELLVAGTGPLLDDLRRTVGPDEPVRFLGFVEDVPSFMAACDVCAATTDAGLGEGFGLSALEAMAAGRPVIASRVGSLPEVVTPDTGIVVPPGSAGEMAKAMICLADEAVRLRLGRAGAVRAAEHFSRDRMVEQTIDLYEAVHA